MTEGTSRDRIDQQLLSRGARVLHERTILVLGVMFAAAGALTLWHLARLSSNLIESAALQGASLQAESLEELRTL